jgi:Tfp pilus assembly protein FimV
VDKITNSDSSISLDQIDASLAASRKELSEIEQQHAHDYSVDQQTEYIVGQEGAVELEVSVYIAYERYDEAEQLLEQALEKEPDNTVLQSQLLEVYAAKGKQQHFELLAAQIGNKGDVQIDNKIKILRTSI